MVCPQAGTNSEWLLSYANFGHLLLPSLKKEARTLSLGCGNSEFSLELLKAGISDIVNIDVSRVVIEYMRTKYADYKACGELQCAAVLMTRL